MYMSVHVQIECKDTTMNMYSTEVNMSAHSNASVYVYYTP